MVKIKGFLKKLTVFDWLVVLVVLAGIIFLSTFIFKKENWVKVEVMVSQPEWWWEGELPPYWLADKIKEGDAQYNGLGEKVAEVIKIRVYEFEENRKKTYLVLNLRAEFNEREKKFVFNHQPLVIGKGIDLELGQSGFTGLITWIEGIEDNRIWEDKIVEARVTSWSDVFPETLGVMPWVAEAISVGDKMKDSQGGVIAEVLEKKVRPAEKIVTTQDGKILVGNDPVKKDVFLTLKIKTHKQNGINYFLEDEKVKINSAISLQLNKIDVLPVITKILE